MLPPSEEYKNIFGAILSMSKIIVNRGNYGILKKKEGCKLGGKEEGV